ncbi:MAG: hypothetical protein ACFFDT_07535, partial [Candidatus Hodarchaeota archaeon]
MSVKLGFGVFFLFISFLFFLGAIPFFVMAGGYLYGPMINVNSDESYIIVLNEDVELLSRTELPWELHELMHVKVRVYPESGKALTMGIVPTGIARAFYENATYTEISSPFDPWKTTINHPGQLGDPSEFNSLFSTTDRTNFGWSPKEGKYTLLIFNNDLSKGIYASFKVGARYYFFNGIALFIGVIGALFFLLGFLLIVKHSRSSKSQPTPS